MMSLEMARERKSHMDRFEAMELQVSKMWKYGMIAVTVLLIITFILFYVSIMSPKNKPDSKLSSPRTNSSVEKLQL